MTEETTPAVAENAVAPAEPVTETPVEKTENKDPVETDDLPEDIADIEKEPVKKTEKTPAEKEAARMAYEARKARQDAARAAEKIAELERKLAEKEQSTDVKPTLKDFESVEDYADALTDWKLRQHQKQQTPKDETPKGINPLVKDFFDKQEAIKRTAPDFDAKTKAFANVIDSNPDVSMAVAYFAMNETKNAPEFLYAISKDPDFAYELANTPVYRIGEKLNAVLKEIQAQKQPGKKVPDAEPISPVKPRGKVKSEDEMTGRELRQKYKML